MNRLGSFFTSGGQQARNIITITSYVYDVERLQGETCRTYQNANISSFTTALLTTLNHEIVQLLHNPSLSFSLCFGVFESSGPDVSCLSLAFTPLPRFTSVGVPSSQNVTLLMALPKDSPWIVAISSSRGLGWRDPSAPCTFSSVRISNTIDNQVLRLTAKAPAPQGEPPWTSERLAS